jgi:hypothetical protein
LKITRIIWLEEIVDKLRWKHEVEEYEVIEVFENKAVFKYKEAGHRSGEDVYAAFGQTNRGRFLSVFFVCTEDQQAIIVSAREMSNREKKGYVK